MTTGIAGARLVVSTRLTPGQVAAVAAVCDRATAKDGVWPLSEHVMLHLRHGGEGRDRHLLVQLDDPCDVLGYAHLDPTDAVAGAAAELVVDPAHRGHGIGRALVTAALSLVPDGRLRLWAHGDQPAARALAAALGFEEVRRLEQWRRSLLSALPGYVVPASIELRAFRPGLDDDAWLDLNARAFAGHPEQGHWTRDDLTARMAESWFDPEGFLVAEDVGDAGAAGVALITRPPAMVAFHWTKVHGREVHTPSGGTPHAHDPIGEVYVVGVDPAMQGQGLGRLVTLAGLHRLRAQGLPQAMLYVEGDNVAAQAVYRALGFTPWDMDVMFHRRPGPVGSRPAPPGVTPSTP